MVNFSLCFGNLFGGYLGDILFCFVILGKSGEFLKFLFWVVTLGLFYILLVIIYQCYYDNHL